MTIKWIKKLVTGFFIITTIISIFLNVLLVFILTIISDYCKPRRRSTYSYSSIYKH